MKKRYIPLCQLGFPLLNFCFIFGRKNQHLISHGTQHGKTRQTRVGTLRSTLSKPCSVTTWGPLVLPGTITEQEGSPAKDTVNSSPSNTNASYYKNFLIDPLKQQLYYKLASSLSDWLLLRESETAKEILIEHRITFHDRIWCCI